MTLDVEAGRVYTAHPVADLFPMLADDELGELVESIRQRGLDHPIVLDREGRVLDGRNRLAACNLAGVEPRFETYDGDDADDYALRSGITRRHLTTGARAMIAAKAARLNGYDYKSVVDRENKITDSRLGEASTVLDWCDTAVVNKIIAGDMPLSKAVEQARRLKKDDAEREAKKSRLRDGAPDLLSRVGEGLDLDEAIAALKVREQRAAEEKAERAAQQSAQEAAERAARVEALKAWNQASDNLTAVLSWAKTYTPPEDTDIYASVADFQRRVTELQLISEQWETRNGDE